MTSPTTQPAGGMPAAPGADAGSHFVLELLGDGRPDIRMWVRSMVTVSSHDAPRFVLIVAACTRCGWRTELPVRCPAPTVRSPLAFASAIADAGVAGFLPEHRGCDGASSGRWRATRSRVPLWVSRDVGARIDAAVEEALAAAYESTLLRIDSDPSVSIDYVGVPGGCGSAQGAMTIAPPPFAPGRLTREEMDAVHAALLATVERAAARRDPPAAVVLTLPRLTRRPYSADVVVVTASGAFRRRVSGQRYSYGHGWTAIVGPDSVVDGLLVRTRA